MSLRRITLALFALVVLAALVPSDARAAGAPRGSLSRIRPRIVADTHVQAVDDRFEPTVPQVPRGGTVVFDFVGPINHHAAADSLLGLYDSGSVAAGGPSTSYTFVAAGIYPFTCVFHILEGMTGRIHVPMQAAPAKGSLQRRFTITWASASAQAGFVYDVRLKRPGRPWMLWRSGIKVPTNAFRPHAGTGGYRFAARLRRSDTDAASLWSDDVSIAVG